MFDATVPALEPRVHGDRSELFGALGAHAMPGLSCVYRFGDGDLQLSTAASPGYPIRVVEDDQTVVALEGRVHGMTADAAFARIADLAKSPHPTAAARVEALRQLTGDWDGEFVALVHHRPSGGLALVADAGGLLPLYTHTSRERIVVSREVAFVLELVERRTPDPLGVAQLLLFAHPIGRRTLISGVERARPGFTLAADRDGARVADRPWLGLELEHKPRRSLSLSRNAGELADILTSAAELRAQDAARDVLGLSGGLDSRAVAAAMVRAGVSFEAYTFLGADGLGARDAPPAEALAIVLGAPWRLLRLSPLRADRARRMLATKLGLNTITMSFGFEFFEQIAAGGGPLRYWSGDGGDKVLPDHRPRLSRAARADLGAYVIEKAQIASPATIARLTGIAASDLAASVRATIASYPERDPQQQYVRFILAERGGHYIQEGEDTNRQDAWTASPFWSRPFVRAAMEIPDAQKTGHELYRAMLRRLDPRVLGVTDANLGMRMDSFLYPWNRRARELSRRFPRLQRLLRRGGVAPAAGNLDALLRRVLQRQLQRPSPVRDAFSIDALQRVASGETPFAPDALDLLVTATCAVERIVAGRSALDDEA